MSIKKNFIYNTLYQILIIILPLITVPYVSRVLGPSGIGKYSYTGAYGQYFVLLGSIGIGLYGSRQIAYFKDDKENLSIEFWNIYFLQLITTSLSLIFYLIFFVVINNNDKNLYLIQSFTVLSSVFDISWFFIGYQDLKSVVIRNAITKILGVLLVFLLVKNESDLLIYTIIMVGSGFLGQIIMWSNLKNKIYLKKVSLKIAITHFIPSIRLFVSQVAIQIYTLLDRTMLGAISNDYEVGLYDNSQKTIKLVLTLITSLGTVMMPAMSDLYSKGDMDEFKKYIYKTFKFVNFISIPMMFGLISVADEFSFWFYGEKFVGINILLKVGALIIIAISWSNILGIQIMIPMKKEKQFTLSVLCGAIINFLLNIILIKKFHSMGSTISSVIAEICVTMVQIYFLKNIICVRDLFKGLIKPLIASIIMYIIIIFIKQFMLINIFYTMIQVVIGIITYLIIMILLKEDLIMEYVYKFLDKLKYFCNKYFNC